VRRLSIEDREWLRAAPAHLLAGAPSLAARFSGGKLSFALVCLLLGVHLSGVDDRPGIQPRVRVHKLAAISSACWWRHLYMALVNPATRHALHGILSGKVDREWARRHYPRWDP
jgi:cytochrome b subunit of formate dehydrogenase